MTIRPLSPELAEKARIELNEDPNRVASDLQYIKEWLSKQPHLRVRMGEYLLFIQLLLISNLYFYYIL